MIFLKQNFGKLPVISFSTRKVYFRAVPCQWKCYRTYCIWWNCKRSSNGCPNRWSWFWRHWRFRGTKAVKGSILLEKKYAYQVMWEMKMKLFLFMHNRREIKIGQIPLRKFDAGWLGWKIEIKGKKKDKLYYSLPRICLTSAPMLLAITTKLRETSQMKKKNYFKFQCFKPFLEPLFNRHQEVHQASVTFHKIMNNIKFKIQ